MTQPPRDEPMPSPGPGGPHAVDRDAHPRRCKAKTRSGARCRQYAVEGMTVCRMHGGSSPQARAAAARRKAEAEAKAVLGLIWDPQAAPITDPVEALLALAGKLQHAVDVLGARVTVDSVLDDATALAWVRVMRELRQALEGIERLGLDEKRIRIAQHHGQLLAGVLRAVLDQLMLSDEQRVLAVEVVPRELRKIATGEVVRGEVG